MPSRAVKRVDLMSEFFAGPYAECAGDLTLEKDDLKLWRAAMRLPEETDPVPRRLRSILLNNRLRLSTVAAAPHCLDIPWCIQLEGHTCSHPEHRS